MKKLLSIIFRKKVQHDPYDLIKRFGHIPKAAR